MNSSITKLHVAPAELFAAILAVVLTAGPGAAQYFGQNKVQYRELDWAVLRTGNFEIYFHEGLREAVVDVGRMAERAYARHSRILDHELADPIQLIIYASQSEFQQTNITPWMVGEGTGGFTEIARRRVALPLTGSYAEFETILTHELVHAFQLDILGGSGDRSVLNPSTYMPPLWFIEGTAEYLSIGGIDPMTEMWLRDGALQGYLTPIKVLDSTYDIRVYRYGQALLHYLGSTYGDHKIGDIYRELPSLRSMERAFEKVVGLTMEKFSEDWTEAMRRSHLPRIAELVKPGEFAFRLTDSGKDRARLSVTPAVSPDGGLMVYFADRALHTELTLASALTGRTQRRLVRGEQDADYESLRFFRSAMDWSPDGSHICFVAASGGRDMVHIQRISDGRIIRRIDTGLDGILSPSFSPDGGWIVFSGLKGGRSALYRVKASGDRLERLTDDMYRAQEPRYSPDGRRIVFVTDQGGEGEIENLIYPPPQLAILDLETGAVEPLDGMAGTNISPFFSQDGRRILYVSDRSGIANLFIRDLDSGEDRRITDIITGISGVTSTSPALSLSRDGRRAVFSAFSKGSWDLYAIKDPMLLWDSHEPDEEPRTPVLAGALLPVQDLPADGADPADCTEAGISGGRPGPGPGGPPRQGARGGGGWGGHAAPRRGPPRQPVAQDRETRRTGVRRGSRTRQDHASGRQDSRFHVPRYRCCRRSRGEARSAGFRRLRVRQIPRTFHRGLRLGQRFLRQQRGIVCAERAPVLRCAGGSDHPCRGQRLRQPLGLRPALLLCQSPEADELGCERLPVPERLLHLHGIRG